MLTQVVSRIRRQFRRSQQHQQQPPDLRRWSGFMNPFPPVSFGGYSRYYAKHGIPDPTPAPTPASSPVDPPPDQQNFPFAQLPFPSSPSKLRRTKRSKGTLCTIAESPSSCAGSPKARMHSLSNTSSLRRRRRQLLRTPSVERDFPITAPKTIPPATDSDNESSQSHSSQTDSVDTPPTTVEGVEENDQSRHKAACPTPDPYDRPDSRSSYFTARSDLSDV